ncbi:MAG TPA: hypothetical protein DEQ09_03495 [Bacteroidales bacterium]|nr:hypothetical protein [Bacteroidales bacterium]
MALISLIKSNGMVVPNVYENIEKDTVHVLISPELTELVDKWIIEYSADDPEIMIRKADITVDKSRYDIGNDGVIGIVTEDYLHTMHGESLWSMVVARDVIVPVISSENPFCELISNSGISPGQFAGFYTEPGKLTWGKVLNTEDNTTVNCYCVGDQSLKWCLAEFLQAENLKGNVRNAGDNAELVEFISKDKYSIGFCRLSAVIDYENHSIKEGLQIVPIDINGNGVLEHNENIYRCLNDFNRGIWIGKYPGSLCRNIHVISTKAPIAVNETDFVQWILSGGQAYISEAGYSELIPGERQPKIQALNAQPETAVIERAEQPVKAAIVLFIAGTVLLVVLIAYVIARLARARSAEPQQEITAGLPAFNDNSVEAPAGVFFDRSHTWAFMEKDGKVKVGIDDFLQHITGKVTRIKMKEAGSMIKRGETFVSLVQNGKQLDIFSPVSGKITETNRELAGNTAMVNNAPFDDGWIYAIEPDNWIKEAKKYFMGDNYREFLKSQFSGLKDFVATTVKPDNAEYSMVILQDGGEIKDGLLENYGPDVWEEFQNRFIDTS